VSTGSKPLLSLIVVARKTGYGVIEIDIKALRLPVFISLLDFKTPTPIRPHQALKPPKA
jgi:hypothetical protein